MAEISPLRRRMIEDMTVRNLSPATQQSYLNAVSKFSLYFGRSPDRLGLEDVHAFQVHLVATGISWPALNQIVCALRFFYGVTLNQDTVPERIAYAREPSKLPVVLSADEVVRFLEAIPSLKSRTALTTVYAAGLEQCDDCGATRIAYNSCRNRHCPKCQGLARAKWLADRQAELLPVPYFHVVFTLPAPLGEIAFQNKAAVYAILFRAAAETLAIIAADPRHLGAQLGMTMVLHTWGQTLQHHPHVHCVVPGGGPSLDGTRWVACRPGFFLPVRVLSRLFRRLFLQELENAFGAGKLRFFTNLANLAEPQAFARRLRELQRLDWVVYAKPPFGGPEQVLAYLGRYTHRVAIANSRLLSLADGKIRFTWKDYRADGKTKVMTLDADEFIRRFLLHALPDGFHRIRHYGFLANGSRGDSLALCRRLLEARVTSAVREPAAQSHPRRSPAHRC